MDETYKKLDILQVNLLADEGVRSHNILPKDAIEMLEEYIKPQFNTILAIGGVTYEGDEYNHDTTVLTKSDIIYEYNHDHTWKEFKIRTIDTVTGLVDYTPVRIPADLQAHTANGTSSCVMNDGTILVTSTDNRLSDDQTFGYMFRPWDAVNPFERIPLEVCRKFAAREKGQLVPLPDGRILRLGGIVYNLQRRVEGFAKNAIYDPATKQWAGSIDINIPEGSYSVVLRTGKLLITGGKLDNQNPTKCSLYDLKTGESETTGRMGAPRIYHAGCMLPDGNIFVCGGMSTDQRRSRTMEIYNVATGKWSGLTDLLIDRWEHYCISTENGEVLIAGDSREKRMCEVWGPTFGSRVILLPSGGPVDCAYVPIYN